MRNTTPASFIILVGVSHLKNQRISTEPELKGIKLKNSFKNAFFTII